MAEVTFGSEDAIYGSGVYAEAVYGEFGPTLIPEGVFAPTSVGALNVSGDSNLSITGVEGQTETGFAEANITELIGQEGSPDPAQGFAGTLQVNISENLESVSASISTGSLTLSGDSNTEAEESSLDSFLGGVQKSGGASAQLDSGELSSNIGTVIIRATVGLTGQQANSSVGFVKANVVEFVPGITVNSFSSGVEIKAGAFEGLTSVSGFSGVGQTSESGEQFDFNGVKELYDRKRTVVLPRVA